MTLKRQSRPDSGERYGGQTQLKGVLWDLVVRVTRSRGVLCRRTRDCFRRLHIRHQDSALADTMGGQDDQPRKTTGYEPLEVLAPYRDPWRPRDALLDSRGPSQTDARLLQAPAHQPPTFSSVFFFFTLVTGRRRSLSHKLRDTRVYVPQKIQHSPKTFPLIDLQKWQALKILVLSQADRRRLHGNKA